MGACFVIDLWNEMKTYAMLVNIWVSRRTSSITQDQTDIINLLMWGVVAWIVFR
jgi:hypothetical protein